jgi:hypothetical protein
MGYRKKDNSKLFLFVVVLSVLFLSACGKQTDDKNVDAATADWAFAFVVFKDAVYRVLMILR